MELKISLIKIHMVMFTLFLILPIILTFETLPMWEENQKSSNLPDNLANSEIIDYAINNKTNERMYFAKGQNYFFYIEGNTYEYTLDKELKYFNSPLIKYSSEYYFCSNLKYIIKITNKKLEEIPNPSCLNDYTDYELKCFFHSNNNIIVVAFLNTKCVNSYDIGQSKWIGQGTYAEEGIKDPNVFNIEKYNSNFAIGIIFKKLEKIIIHVYNYDENMYFAGQYHLGFEGDLYSKSLFTYGFRDSRKKGFIFTYEPKKMNEYNFIYLDIEGQYYQCKEGKLLFNNF